MNIKQEIIKKLEGIVKELTNNDSASSSKEITIELSIPSDESHGDYSTNIALRLAKVLGKNPLEIAKEIAEKLSRHFELVSESQEIPDQVRDDGVKGLEKSEEDSSRVTSLPRTVSRVEAVSPGFINFYLSKDALLQNAERVLQSPEEILGMRKHPKYPKAIVEYSSPNIAKPFTIGHFRSTIIGDAIANLLEAAGYEVYRDNHLGDWGTQFGKQIYAIKNIPLREYPEGTNTEQMNEAALEKSENPIKDLVAIYVRFHEEAEKHPELEEEGRKWFKKLEEGDAEARRLWQKCIDLSFKEFDKIYGQLGVPSKSGKRFENNGRGYGEAYFEGKMQPIINELREKGFLKEDKGAQLVFFPQDKYPPLMIVKSDGATLYATRDLATDKFRLAHYGKDILVINEVGAEQSLYWKQIFETEELLGWYKPGQRVHVGHGMFRFKEGKMSTRKGNVIWLEDVLREAGERAEKLGSQNKPTAEQVGIGALKWNDLKRSAHLDVVFDWDEILSMQGNSGPYVQYTYTRTHSVLDKAGLVIASEAKQSTPSQVASSPAAPRNDGVSFPTNYTPNPDELKILRIVQKFGETVESAAAAYSPNIVTEYLFTLSQLFNNFYQKYRILNAETEEEKQFRLALTATVGVILKQGLGLLGIAAPEKM